MVGSGLDPIPSGRVKLAVVTPTYNRPDTLRTLILSFARQDLAEGDSLCIVDDGSDLSYDIDDMVPDLCKDRVFYRRIENSGPLVARNHGMETATTQGATHLLFVDDDDEIAPDAFRKIRERLIAYPDLGVAYFRSNISPTPGKGWPPAPTKLSWISDVAEKRRLASDPLCVVASRLVGDCRFSRHGRNQREWTFFACLAKKRDDVMTFPEEGQLVHYQEDGLSAKAVRKSTLAGTLNQLHRTAAYLWLKPGSGLLWLRFCRQLAISPVRLSLIGGRSLFGRSGKKP